MMTKLPQIKGYRLVKALEKAGWYIDHTRGSHVIMRHPTKIGVVAVVPVHNTPLKPGTLHNILKTTGVSVDELLELL